MSSCVLSRAVMAGTVGFVLASLAGVPALGWALAVMFAAVVVVQARRQGAGACGVGRRATRCRHGRGAAPVPGTDLHAGWQLSGRGARTTPDPLTPPR